MIAQCPHCKKKVKINDESAGRERPCPACGKAFSVPPFPKRDAERAEGARTSAPLRPARASTDSSTSPSLPGGIGTGAPPTTPDKADVDGTPQAAASGEPVSPTTPPPLPPRRAAHAKPARPETILEGYRKPPKSHMPKVGATIMSGVGNIKERARAAKLKHDVNNLRSALDEKWEQLGTLTLEHRPADVDVTTELAELGLLHEAVSEKQEALESLQRTKGGGSVVRQLKHEVAQLRDRQRTSMIAVGRKAETAAVELPGAAGHRSAIQRLRSALEAKENELARLQEALGPIADTDAVRGAFESFKKPLTFVGVMVGAALVLYVVWAILLASFFGDSFARYAYYVPDSVAAVSYFNVSELRGIDPFSEIEGAIPRQFTLGLDVEDIAEIFLVLDRRSKPTLVLRTVEDLSLEDIASLRGDTRTRYRDMEYVRGQMGAVRGFMAKTESRTFCVAEGEEDLKSALRRVDRKEKPDLAEDMRRAVDHVAGHDHFLVLTGQRHLRGYGPEGIKAVGAGFSAASSIKAKAIMVFARERDAEKCEQEVEDGITELYDEAESLEPILGEHVLGMLDALGHRRSGDVVRFSWKYDVADIMALLDELESSNWREEFVREVLQSISTVVNR